MMGDNRSRTVPHKRGGQPDEYRYGRDLVPGAQVSSYLVEELRSRGGFATIYRARHVKLQRIAALKVLHRSLLNSPNMVTRFQQEAQAVNLVHHPNVVDVYEVGDLSDGRPYALMEWLEGTDLDEQLRNGGPLSPHEVLALMEELCGALAAVHSAGIVHRDLKASNVFMVRSGTWSTVKLVDFGIAKVLRRDDYGWENDLSTRSVRLGTPATMAPEQILGLPVDRRTDLYALGVLLHELLTGFLPFRADTPEAVQQLHLESPVPKASERVAVPADVDAVIARCMAKQAADRYDNADEVLRDLRKAIAPRATPSTFAGRALGLFVEASSAEGDGALDAVIDRARRLFADAEIETVADTGTSLLGIAPLSDDPEQRRARCLALVRSVIELATLARADGVAATIAVRTGRVQVRIQDGVRRLRSPLMTLSSWGSELVPGAITASTDLVRDLPLRCDATNRSGLMQIMAVDAG